MASGTGEEPSFGNAMSFVIRRAETPSDWQVCRTLLPEECALPVSRRDGLLVLGAEDGRIAGAAVVHCDLAEAWVFIRVVRPLRRQGAGTLLMEAALSLGRTARARHAVAVTNNTTDPGATELLRKAGFEEPQRFTEFEADFQTALPYLTGTREKLMRTGRLPEGVEVTTVPLAPQDQVALLYSQYIDQRTALGGAAGTLLSPTERWSRAPVIMRHGRVLGVLLVQFEGETPKILARVVAPGSRGGFVNALLMGAAADLGVSMGSRHFQFESSSWNLDTLALARKTKARVLREKFRFQKAL